LKLQPVETPSFSSAILTGKENVRCLRPDFLRQCVDSTVSGLESGAYKIITGAIPPVPIPDAFVRKFPIPADQEPNFKMLDLRGQTPRFRVSGDFATFTGFTSPDDTSNWIRIDFVFGGSNGGWYAIQSSVLLSVLPALIGLR
jgi:hypothetical protein